MRTFWRSARTPVASVEAHENQVDDLGAKLSGEASPIPDEAPVTTAQGPKRAAKSFISFCFGNFGR
jgi:hypothetical protein